MSKIGPDHYRYFARLEENGVHICCERFVVVGETPRCYYVAPANYAFLADIDWSGASEHLKKMRKRILKSSGRRYCYPDKQEALNSFKARQRWRLSHAKTSLSIAQLALKGLEEIEVKKEFPDESRTYNCKHDEHTSSFRWE